MSLVTSKIRTFIKSRKLNVFLIFFILAFFILILARLTANYTNTLTVNVKLEQVPDQMVVLNDSTSTLDITMTANGFSWMRYYLKSPLVVIDFKNEIKKTDSLYVWSLSRGYPGVNAQFGKNIIVKTINPDTLYFNIEVNAIKKVPVIPNLKLNYAPGYNVLNTIVASPDSVKLIGPATLLSKIVAVETKGLKKSNINKPLTSRLQINVDSINPQIALRPKEVTVAVAVEKFTEGVFSLPVSIRNVPKHLKVNYFPKTINVSYYTSLNAYKTIKASDFEVICDFKEHDGKTSFLTPKLIKLPKAIKTARLHQQKIEYIISE